MRSWPRSSPAASTRRWIPGVSLFEQEPGDGSLQFVAGDNNTYDPVETTQGYLEPLYDDSALYASLTAGVYYLAVADGFNTPSPLEGFPAGSYGVLDPNVPGSAQNGFTTGPYVLNVLVQPTPEPPHVVSTSPADGATLAQPPTQLTVTFNEPVNIAQLAYQTYQVTGENALKSVYIEGADETEYYPRFESYDSTTNQATFLMLDGLPDGDYQLHLSGSAGMTDLGGNQLVGNEPDGDYVVSFAVDGPSRGIGGNPLDWSDQETNDAIQDPQDLGVLFPDELAAGVTITRDFLQDPTSAPRDTADVYEFQTIQDGSYLFSLSGASLPEDVTLTLMDSSGQILPLSPIGPTALYGQLAPGTYLLMVSGWDPAPGGRHLLPARVESPESANDNAPPLLSGPAPAVAIRFSGDATTTSPTSTSTARRRRRRSPHLRR